MREKQSKYSSSEPLTGVYDVPAMRRKALSVCLWRQGVDLLGVGNFRKAHMSAGILNRKQAAAWLQEHPAKSEARLDLDAAARAVVEAIGVSFADAVALVLSDQHPPTESIRVMSRLIRPAASVQSGVSLFVPLNAAPEELARFWADLRARLAETKNAGRIRPLVEPKRIELARFYAAHGEEACSADGIEKWNRQHPTWVYQRFELKTFNRDCRQAFARMIHPEWAGRANGNLFVGL